MTPLESFLCLHMGIGLIALSLALVTSVRPSTRGYRRSALNAYMSIDSFASPHCAGWTCASSSVSSTPRASEPCSKHHGVHRLQHIEYRRFGRCGRRRLRNLWHIRSLGSESCPSNLARHSLGVTVRFRWPLKAQATTPAKPVPTSTRPPSCSGTKRPPANRRSCGRRNKARRSR